MTADPNLLGGFIKTLNRHGFAFQYAVIAEAHDAFDNGNSRFAFEAAEVPVRVQESETKIDIVLRHVLRPMAMVCECKRVNPNIANWCFVKAPWVHRQWQDSVLVLDFVHRRTPDAHLEVNTTQLYSARPTYQIAIEMRTHPGPDRADTALKAEGGGGRADFERAVRQVLLATNGLLNFYLSQNDLGPPSTGSKLLFLPVVVTTANLWVSDIDLNETDVSTGEFPVARADLKPAEWVVYHEHMSPALKFDTPPKQPDGDLSRTLQVDFIRSVLVVSASHFRKFSEWASGLSAG